MDIFLLLISLGLTALIAFATYRMGQLETSIKHCERLLEASEYLQLHVGRFNEDQVDVIVRVLEIAGELNIKK